MANTDRPRSIRFYLNDPLDASLEEFMAIIGEKNFTSYVKERIFEHLMEMTDYKFKNSYTAKGVQATLAVNFLKELQAKEMDLKLVNQPASKPESTTTPPASTPQTSDESNDEHSHNSESGESNEQPSHNDQQSHNNESDDNASSKASDANEEISAASQEESLSEGNGEQEEPTQETDDLAHQNQLNQAAKAFTGGGFKINTNG